MIDYDKIKLIEKKFILAHELWDRFNLTINKDCQHEYKKTIAKSGMYFMMMCHKCNSAYTQEVFNDNQ